PGAMEQSVFRLFERAGRDDPGRAIAGVPIASLMLPTDIEDAWLLPASTALATVDRMLGTREGMGRVLARAFRTCAGRFDHVLIDCPPVFGILMLNAMAAADSLIVPVQTEFLALKGLERMLHTLVMVNRARLAPLEPLIVPTMYDQRTRASRESLLYLRQHHADRLWQGVIPVDTRFREASRIGRPLTLMDGNARGAVAYSGLVSYLLDGDAAGSAPMLPIAGHDVAAPARQA
ncbi:MAG: ParA family protein, partial [Planctomycetes bacterium]|nr:ParA family protein [Planctomycetota bacterium]